MAPPGQSGMRMIESDNIQLQRLRRSFGTHQFFRPNKKTIALVFFFARIRDGIDAENFLGCSAPPPAR
jgi:hypothetical protein